MDKWSTSPTLETKGRNAVDEKAGETVKDLIRTIYGHFNIKDDIARVGLITSGTTAKIAFDFNSYKDLDQLDEAVEYLSLPKSSDSNIGKLL